MLTQKIQKFQFNKNSILKKVKYFKLNSKNVKLKREYARRANVKSNEFSVVYLNEPQSLFNGKNMYFPQKTKYLGVKFNVDGFNDIGFLAERSGGSYTLLNRIKFQGLDEKAKKFSSYENLIEVVETGVDMEMLEQLEHLIKSKIDKHPEAANSILNSIQLWKYHRTEKQLHDVNFEQLSIILDKMIQLMDIEQKSVFLSQELIEKSNLTERIQFLIDIFQEEMIRKMDATNYLKNFEKFLPQKDRNVLQEKVDNILANELVPENVKDVVKSEYEKLVQSQFGEYTIISYLELIFKMPWGIYTEDNKDILAAKGLLEESHYGLQKVKDRILEFISVGILTNNVSGKILCLIGPPGTGKTSIAKSIAKVLNRQYYSLSVAALDDFSEIKGHRKTYVAAMPGRIIEGITVTKTSNPVMIIDEIDKLGSVRRGASHALLEVLDPSQNDNFMDHFLDISYDLSKVLFICTANYENLIPHVLKDRMEVIKISGYVDSEKMQIAKLHLIPKIFEGRNITIADEVIQILIHTFCKEPGVRRLQQVIKRMMEKASMNLLTVESVSITEENYLEFLDYPEDQFIDKYYENFIPGVSVTLFGSYGGLMGYIESVAVPKKKDDKGGALTITGSLDTVMQESTDIAFTLAKNHVQSVDPENKFFADFNVHMHLPTGGMEKTGSEIGCAMCLSLLSLATNIELDKNIAHIGELTLIGKVLPVKSLAPLIQAAKRAGILNVTLPSENEQDWRMLDKTVTDNIVPHFVKSITEVIDIAFPKNN